MSRTRQGLTDSSIKGGTKQSTNVKTKVRTAIIANITVNKSNEQIEDDEDAVSGSSEEDETSSSSEEDEMIQVKSKTKPKKASVSSEKHQRNVEVSNKTNTCIDDYKYTTIYYCFTTIYYC